VLPVDVDTRPDSYHAVLAPAVAIATVTYGNETDVSLCTGRCRTRTRGIRCYGTRPTKVKERANGIVASQ